MLRGARLKLPRVLRCLLLQLAPELANLARRIGQGTLALLQKSATTQWMTSQRLHEIGDVTALARDR